MSYTLYIASKSVLYTLHSVRKYLLDSLSVLSEVQAQLATAQGECGTHLAELHDVIRAEQAKVAARSSEARARGLGT